MSSNKFRLIVVDVDGTLLSPDGILTPVVRDAILSINKSKCLFTLATGRSIRSIRAIVDTLNISTPLILHSGSLIQDPITDKVIYEDYLPMDSIKEIIDILLAKNLQPVLYTHPSVGGNRIAGPISQDSIPEMTDFLANRIKATRVSLGQLRYTQNVIGVSAFSPTDDMANVQDLIEKNTNAKALIYRPNLGHSMAWYRLEVFTRECSKGKALNRLIRLLGIQNKEVLSIGDNLNDVDLLLESGLRIAMGNAPNELMSVAHAIVGSNEQNGVAEAIEKYVIGYI